MKIKCMVVDDEPLAIEVLKSHIEKIEMLEVTVCCENAFEAFEWLNRKKIDLLFLDIQMPGMKGTDFLRNIKNPPRVILTTAYRDYALEGYELDVLDYLVKPISFERFFKAVNKLLHPPHESGTIAFNPPEASTGGFIYVKVNKKIHKILLSDILYTDSLKDYITIHTPTGNITAKHTLTAFEEMLPENEFLRIHRSFIVSIKKITGFTASTIEIAGAELPIGRNYRQHVFKVLNYVPLKDI